MDVAVDPGLGHRRRIGPNAAAVAMRQIEHEETGLLFHAANHDRRLTEVSLRMARRMSQRHEHLLAALIALAHVILDDRVAAGEATFIAKPVEYPLGRMALLARHLQVFIKPMLDRRNKRVQLRAPDRQLPLIARRCRIGHHLGHAVARYVEMLCCLSPAHPFRNSQPNPQIKFHGVDPLSLLRSLQKGNRWPDFTPPAPALCRRYRGRLFHRRSQLQEARPC